MTTHSVAGLQMDVAWEDARENCARVRRFVVARRPSPGTLVVLPELFSSGFSFDAAAVAQPCHGETERFLEDLARENGIWLVAGVAVAGAGGKATNEAVILGPDGAVKGRYRKQRPFTPGGEHRHYAAGTEPVMVTWGEARVAVFICYDLRFPELFRTAAARWKPELFLVIASWPDTRIGHWLKLLQARAIENQAYVLGVNRVGSDPSHHHPGRSVLVNPWGEILGDAGEAEGWVGGDLDLARLGEYRAKLPFLGDLSC